MLHAVSSLLVVKPQVDVWGSRLRRYSGGGDSLRDGAGVARRAHNSEVAGSNPAPATARGMTVRGSMILLVVVMGWVAGSDASPFRSGPASSICGVAMFDSRVDMSDIKDLHGDLERFKRSAVPFATRRALTASAFETRSEWQRTMEREFTLRNQFTKRSVRVDKARGLDVRTMEAAVGSIAPYLFDQEYGTVERSQGKHGKPIPTAVAAGQAMGARPRTRPVRRPHWLPNIRLSQRSRTAATRRQKNAMSIRRARDSGRKFVFLELDDKKGIFKIMGGRRMRMRMIWDMSEPAVRVPASPTLQPALKSVEGKLLDIHYDALLEQLRRHRILGY